MLEKLTNPPLIEAILEIKWELRPNSAGDLVDSYYSLLIGKIHERIFQKFPEYFPLPLSDFPVEMIPYCVQYQYRSPDGKWPLCQLGPGILTYNDGESEDHTYSWETLKTNSDLLLNAFFESYPSKNDLKIKGVHLHYMNGLDVHFEQQSIFNIINDALSVSVAFPPTMFERTPTVDKPFFVDIKTSFPHENPQGIVNIGIKRGNRNGKDMLFVDLGLQTNDADVPQGITSIKAWIENAHQSSHDLFSALFAKIMEQFK